MSDAQYRINDTLVNCEIIKIVGSNKFTIRYTDVSSGEVVTKEVLKAALVFPRGSEFAN